jgi:hypothetical protein
MKRPTYSLALLAVLTLSATTAHALSPTQLWSQRFGSTSVDAGMAVAVDVFDNVFVTGYFSNTANFGGGNLESSGPTDIFLAKYDATGAHQWSLRFGGAGDDNGVSIAVDNAGSVIITGFFQQTVNFGGADLVSVGSSDIFVASFSADGIYNWSRRLGGTVTEQSRSLAVDFFGNVLVTGEFKDTVDFGGGGLTSAGGSDIFLVKCNQTGAHVWSKRFGGTSDDQGWSVATHGVGDVMVAGDFGDTMDLGGGNLVSAGGTDLFLAMYDAAGVHGWSRSFGSASNETMRSLAVDDLGNAIITGYFSDSVDFGGGNLVTAGAGDIFLAKFGPAGTHQWSHRHGGVGADTGNSVATDALGNVYLTGYFSDTMDMGGGNLTSNGTQDIFIAKFDANGVHQVSRGSGSFNMDIGFSIATSGSVNAVMTGSFSGTVSFGIGNLVSIAGSQDVFLAKYEGVAAQPEIMSITDVGNDQGYQVKILFNRSAYDQEASSTPVIQYEAYRRDDPPPASSQMRRDLAGASTRELLADGWIFARSAPAHAEQSYGMVVPTIGDSTLANGPYYSVFFIRAATAMPAMFVDSPIDSGYSVDNLAPAVPGGFAYNAGVLAWNQSTAADFDYFTVYGSNTNDFGAATVVDYSVGPSMDVTAAPYIYYFVTATDFAGNEGLPATINTLSDVDGTPRSYVLSVNNYPNPFNPRTTVSYTVPVRGLVTVAIYDARGVLVATLVNNEDRAPNAYRVEWNGHSSSGAAVSSGVYFARIAQNGVTRSKKMVLLK